MPLSGNWEILAGLFPQFHASDEWLPRLQRHWELIETAAPRVQVTSVSAEDAVMRHYAESLELLSIIERHQEFATLSDVGSGGGFPGLVISAVRPDIAVHLIEPLKKRATLLTEMAEELGLRRVTVHPVRAEEAGRGPIRDAAEVVTARAVASVRLLLEYTAPLAAPGALIALPKGSSIEEELAAAERAMPVLAVSYDATEPMRGEVSPLVRVALFRKTGATPAAYPRRPGVAAKRPL